MKARSALVVFVLVSVVAGAETTTVYRHVGADGVVSFSDEALPGATPVAVETAVPHPEDIERAGDLHEQQLEMSSVLEADRLADEAAAARRREAELELARARATALADDATEPEERYVYSPWYAPLYPPRYPEHPHKPVRPPGHGGGKPDEPSPKTSRPLGTGSH